MIQVAPTNAESTGSLVREFARYAPQAETPLALDLLEAFASEQDVDIRLERRTSNSGWVCVLRTDVRKRAVRGRGGTAREAIKAALRAIEDADA